MKNACMLVLGLAFATSAAACGGDTGGDQAEPAGGAEVTSSAEPIGTVTIVEPQDGSVVEGPDVTVRLAVEGFPIVPSGDMTPNTGHHHLYLDADLTPASEPVPTVENQIIHMGDASDTFTFRNVPSGEHRIIAVVADGAHFPLQPWVVDTVTITVP